MPKNPKLNIARYKVGGGELNPFEFHQNQQAFVEQQQHDADNLIPGTPPEMKSEAEEHRGGSADASAMAATTLPTKTRNKLPPKTRRQAGTKKASTKKAVSQKGREKSTKKSTKKSAKKTKPAKRSAASKGRPAKKAAKRSTKKAAKKTGTKKKARK